VTWLYRDKYSSDGNVLLMMDTFIRSNSARPTFKAVTEMIWMIPVRSNLIRHPAYIEIYQFVPVLQSFLRVFLMLKNFFLQSWWNFKRSHNWIICEEVGFICVLLYLNSNGSNISCPNAEDFKKFNSSSWFCLYLQHDDNCFTWLNESKNACETGNYQVGFV